MAFFCQLGEVFVDFGECWVAYCARNFRTTFWSLRSFSLFAFDSCSAREPAKRNKGLRWSDVHLMGRSHVHDQIRLPYLLVSFLRGAELAFNVHLWVNCRNFISFAALARSTCAVFKSIWGGQLVFVLWFDSLLGVLNLFPGLFGFLSSSSDAAILVDSVKHRWHSNLVCVFLTFFVKFSLSVGSWHFLVFWELWHGMVSVTPSLNNILFFYGFVDDWLDRS